MENKKINTPFLNLLKEENLRKINIDAQLIPIFKIVISKLNDYFLEHDLMNAKNLNDLFNIYLLTQNNGQLKIKTGDLTYQGAASGEYSKENLLAFEKEVLGIYISGHPLEEYEGKWRKMISATTADFQPDEETGRTKVRDGAKEIIGGMITDKTVKHTKTNQMMAFVTVEDLLGTVEVVVFPRDYEKNREYLEPDSKVFIRGRVSEEEEKASKLICEKVIPFERTKKELWIQFPDKASYLDEEEIVYGYLADSEGDDEVVIYCSKERAVKRFPKNRNIRINPQILSRLMNHYGESRVKVVEKAIENHF